MSATVPDPPALDAAYLEAARQGQLAVQRCQDCLHWIYFSDVLCPACCSERLAYETADGAGSIETFTVIHRVFVPGFEDLAPYAVGWVALDLQPGLRVFADFMDVPHDRLRIGLRVSPVFTPQDSRGRLLRYTHHDDSPTATEEASAHDH